MSEFEDIFLQSGRSGLVDALKSARMKMLADFDERMNVHQLTGLEAMYAHANDMDELLWKLSVFIANQYKLEEQLTLVAVGGYGRKELAPCSDIDLLILVRNSQVNTDAISELVSLLWDMGLKVGQSVRTPEECINDAKSDITIATNMLEARFICGDEALFYEFDSKYTDLISDENVKNEFFNAKILERNSRHERMGQSKYLLEPNIKESRGGLRDLHLLFWLSKYLFSITDIHDLVANGLISEKVCETFLKAHKFLTTVRCHLHLFKKKPGDVLTLDMQQKIAEKMGYTDRLNQNAVERFMKHYYLISKDVGELSWIFTVAISEYLTTAQSIEPIENEPYFCLINDKIALKESADLNLNPVLIIKTFYLKALFGKPIYPDTLTKIKQNAKLVRKLRSNKEARDYFFKIIMMEHCESTVRNMLESSVIAMYIPEFIKIIAQVQFDMYHIYTTDEHSLKTLGYLCSEYKGENFVLPLTALLHDIGKGMGHHEIVGAEIAKKITTRLGILEAEADDVCWLIRNHLKMSETAFRRDIEDKKTIADFANIVQSPERLKKLYLLTRADIKAVGPNVWNGFKERLLLDLFNRTLNYLNGNDQEINTLSKAQQELKDKIISKIAQKETLTDFLIEQKEAEGITEINVVIPDSEGLFAHITGVMSLNEVSIISAKIRTIENIAFDTFLVTDKNHNLINSEKKLNRICDQIKNRIELPKITNTDSTQSNSIQIFIDQTVSDASTMIEINAVDQIGFLHKVTSAMSKLKLSIASAHIYTYGTKIVDVFYVKDKKNNKIQDEELIKERLLEILK
ncbi:MAG: [protein-PII] uridylyltransferase [Alphaproteobacteria bacterium]|nr:[protein-PII] uridylyltransferase [Alphaproteobacteria bacterium]